MKKILLVAILILALFLRTYRTSDFLGFWFDQGRDAKVVWDIWHSGKLTLIGPTTGIEGIFLGPFYYYLITPAYMLGGGNPVYPAVFLALLNVVAIYFIYKLGEEYFGSNVGLLDAFITALSQQFVSYQRWLSNPNPLPLFAVIALYCLLRRRWWLVGLSVGLSLQLEAASAIFFLPAILLIAFIHKKKIPFIAIAFFVLTLLPQLVFNFRHQNILFNSFKRFLVSERSFQPSLGAYTKRLNFYYTAFTDKYYTTNRARAIFAVSLLAFFLLIRRRLPAVPTTTLVIWWATPMVFLLFYYGNHGYVWDYYFTGVYSAFTLLVSAVWIAVARHLWAGRWLIAVFITGLIFQNLSYNLTYFRQASAGHVTLTPEIQAVDWIYQDAGSTPFNTDVYVPPVIPHAYDYLFMWRGKSVQPTQQLVSRLYTLAEPDPGQKQLLDLWMFKQAGLSSIEKTMIFGPITVQRRVRHGYEQ